MIYSPRPFETLLPETLSSSARVRLGRRDVLKCLVAGTCAPLVTGRAAHGTGRASAPRRTPDWTRLQSRIEGRVIPRDGTGYEGTRHAMVWNAAKPDRFPDAIVRAASEPDVVEAIRFAREHTLKVAVRGGGHNTQNAALRQGGLLLDLSGLNRVVVSAGERTALVEPGVTGAAFMGGLARDGLAFPVGHCPDVRLSGFLLNGGLGWNLRVWGPSCASIQAIDLVDARGERLRADRNQNADLFWAARGAGPGFFAAVTRFHLKLFALPRALMRSTLTYSIEDVDKVAAWLAQLVPLAAPVELRCSCFSREIQIDAVAFTDTAADARKALGVLDAEPAGLKALKTDLYKQASVESVFGRPDATAEAGPRYVGDTGWSNASPRELLSRAGTRLRTAPAGSLVLLVFFHADPRPPLPDMSFSTFASTYVHVHAVWDDAARDALNRAWVRDTTTALDPLKVGHYVGEADLTISPDRPRQCFSPEAWDRLISLKQAYDPEDVFFSYLQ